jgi:hypothetical protein
MARPASLVPASGQLPRLERWALPAPPRRYTSTALPAAAPSSSAPPRKKKGGYEPKWKKKQTLAEQTGVVVAVPADGGAVAPVDLSKVGIKGNVLVVFKQGNATKANMAMAGQPLRDVATQAGQFIKYGCGKGECGTCEALYVRAKNPFDLQPCRHE